MNLTKAQKMLLGIAIGDAFGRSYENQSKEKIQETFEFTKYKNDVGTYTDDTQMTLAVAELMTSNFEFNAESLASNFVYAYKRDKHKGYSTRTKENLIDCYCGLDFLKKYPDHIKKDITSNGSVMRTIPIGLYKDPAQVINYSQLNANISHAHPESIFATIFLSLISHNLYYDKCNIKNIIKFTNQEIQKYNYTKYCDYINLIDELDHFDTDLLFGKGKKGLPCDALKTVGTVLYLYKQYYNDPKEALKQSIIIGGDVDSSASQLLGLVMMHNQMSKLPEFLIDNLENKTYGRDYIINLGMKLTKKFKTSDNL